MADFTGPGVAIKRGRRQKPRTTAGPGFAADYVALTGFVARLPPSSFGSRFRREKQQNSFLGPWSPLHVDGHCTISCPGSNGHANTTGIPKR
jgi:hypothetical protein